MCRTILGSFIIRQMEGFQYPGGVYSRTHVFPYDNRIEVAQNDRINFQTVQNTSDATNNIVSLLIEFDL